MKKLIAVILSACLLSAGPVNVFAQAIQNSASQSLTEKSKIFQNEDKKIFQASSGDWPIWGMMMIIPSIAGLIATAEIPSLFINENPRPAFTQYSSDEALEKLLRERDTRRAAGIQPAENDLKIQKFEQQIQEFENTELSKSIDETALSLGKNLNKSAYMDAKLGAFHLWREPRWIGQINGMRPEEFTRYTERLNILYKNHHNLEALLANKKGARTFFNEEMHSLPVLPCEESLMIQSYAKKIFENKILIIAALVGAAAFFSQDMEAKVNRVTMNPALAFSMNPESTDAEVFNAIDSLQDKTLHNYLSAMFDEAHKTAQTLKGMPAEQRTQTVAAALNEYKENKKEVSFDRERKEKIEAQGQVLTNSLSRFTK